MASADQLKALLNSYLEGDEEQFLAVAMQVAAHEAKLGHGKLAQELRDLIDQAKSSRGLVRRRNGHQTPITRAQRDLASLLLVSYPGSRLGDMVLSDDLAKKLNRVIREQRQAERILAHGLSPRRKLLLVGPPGTGKTMSAGVLAGELGLPLLQVRLDGLITKYLGETAAKLRQIFEATDQTRGVYFFDEFDAIGAHRGLSNDVGEIRRILNSFLLMIEQDQSHSLIVAATNQPVILDHALFRRFDDVLNYVNPEQTQIAALLRARLSHSATRGIPWESLADTGVGLSHAEVTRAADEVLKEALINQREQVTEADIRRTLVERQEVANRLRGTP
jgi:SpoVK/Ycf46/Vps4 family AAA+-type ATPase